VLANRCWWSKEKQTEPIEWFKKAINFRIKLKKENIILPEENSIELEILKMPSSALSGTLSFSYCENNEKYNLIQLSNYFCYLAGYSTSH